MKIEPVAIDGLPIEGLLVVEPPVFADSRGYFFESYNETLALRAGIGPRFVQDNQSLSAAGVLRGLHAQLLRPQGKLVRVVAGAVFDVAVDLRIDSPTFAGWFGVELSADNRRQLWVPPGFAHGFLALADDAQVLYKCTELYDPTDEIGLCWDDPDVAIEWPVDRLPPESVASTDRQGTRPVLSDKDAALPSLADLRPRLADTPAYSLAAGPPSP